MFSFLKKFLVIALLMIVLLPLSVNAQGYQPLVSLPGASTVGEPVSFVPYVQGIYKLAIGLAIGLAVVMMILGGIQYLSTDAIFDKKEGKKKIQNALFGLAMVLISWLILYEINPRLVEFDLSIKGSSSAPSSNK